MRGISPIVGSIRRGSAQSLLPKSPSSGVTHLRQYHNYEGVGNSHVMEIRARSTADEFARLAKEKIKQMVEDANGALGFESQPIKGDLKEALKANIEK